jgi:hypothetical protein
MTDERQKINIFLSFKRPILSLKRQKLSFSSRIYAALKATLFLIFKKALAFAVRFLKTAIGPVGMWKSGAGWAGRWADGSIVRPRSRPRP